MTTPTLPTLGYIRVSTFQQAESGLGLEAQEAKIRAMATLKGIQDLQIVTDAAESAKDLDRPGIQRVLEKVRRREVGMVIVAKLDRLTRSVRDICDLADLFRKKRVELVSVAEAIDTATANGKLMLHILSSFSEWERGVIGERTRDALQAKKRRGEPAGHPPYGYSSVDGRLVPNDDEQHVVNQIGTLHRGGYSLRRIAAELNDRGIRTRRGGEWRFQYVAGVLSGSKN